MDDLARLVFSNIQTPQGSYHVSSETDALFNKIMRIINTVTEERNSWAKELSKNKSSGYMERSVFVPKEYLKAIENKLNALQGQIKQAKVPYGFNYKTDTDIRTLSTDISLTGDNALSQAVKEAAAYGGRFDRRTGRLTLPVQSGMYEKITTGGTQQQYIEDKLKNAYKASRDTEQQREAVRREREADKIAREEAKQIERATKEEAKREAKSKKLNAWFKSEGERAAAKEYQEKLDKSKQKEEDDKENKKENFLSSFLKDPLVKILTFFGLTVSLLRRIILNMPKQAIDTAKETQKNDVLTGLALGLTKRQLRDFKIFETAHGLEEGTIVGAIKEVNETFGRIDKLENDSVQVRNMAKLGTAAYGAKGSGKANEFIQRLVTMDITQEQPDVLLAEIVNAATEAYNKRMNLTTMSSVDANGVPYSSEASMRSILSYLEEAGFQDAAVLFLQKIWDKESGYYEPFGDYASWLKTTRTNKTDIPDAYLDALTLVSQQFNDIAATLKDVVDSALTRFAVSLVKIADWIEEQDWLLSPEEKLIRNRENIEKNKEQAAKYQAEMKYTEQSFRARYKEKFGTNFKGKMGDGLPSEIFEDAQLVADWAMYLDYMDAMEDVNKELEQGKKGKKVAYHQGQHDLRYRRTTVDQKIDWMYAMLQEGVIDIMPDVIPVDRTNISKAEAALIQGSFEEYKKDTDISFAKPEDMSPEDYIKAIKQNPVLMKILDLYNQSYNLTNKNEMITPEKLLQDSVWGRDYGTNASAVQTFWNNMSVEDQALFLEGISRKWGDVGNLAQAAVYTGTKRVAAPAKSYSEQKQAWNEVLSDYEMDEASLLRAVKAPAGSTVQSYNVHQDSDSRHAVIDINIKTPEGNIERRHMELKRSTTGYGGDQLVEISTNGKQTTIHGGTGSRDF